MNKIILCGRVVRDFSLKQTNSGKSVATMTIAVNRSFGEGADFFDCTCWGKTAETASKYLSKGRSVLIEGAMQSRKYKGKDGNERTAWEVQVDRLHFVDSGNGKKQSESKAEPQFEEEIDPGNLPF